MDRYTVYNAEIFLGAPLTQCYRHYHILSGHVLFMLPVASYIQKFRFAEHPTALLPPLQAHRKGCLLYIFCVLSVCLFGPFCVFKNSAITDHEGCRCVSSGMARQWIPPLLPILHWQYQKLHAIAHPTGTHPPN